MSNLFISEDEILAISQEVNNLTALNMNVSQTIIDQDYMQLIEWQDHPEKFLKDIFGFDVWTCPDADDQLDILHAVRDHERVSVRSGNGVGKTAVAAVIAIWFLTCFVPSKVITTAPTTRQVEKLLWGEIRTQYKKARFPLGGELLNTEIRLDDEWFAVGFATDEPEKFQGFHSPHILVICDEASGVSEPIYEAIEGLLTSANVKLLLIGNPTNATSYFGRTHLHPGESKSWVKLNINCWNSPNVRAGRNIVPALCSCDWPQKRLDAWGEHNPFYQVRVLGNFPESGEDNLVPYHMVHSALDRVEKGIGNKIVSVDVARFGGDKSVISRLWGPQFRVLRKIWNQDGEMLANAVVEQIKKEENRNTDEIKIDVIGWGASCFDSLKRKKKFGSEVEKDILKNIRIIPINVSEKCKSKEAKKDYFNVRAEAGFSIRKMFEDEAIDIDDEELGVQLANLKYKFRDGRYLLEPKEDYKSRFRESPDELDSLLIAKAITRGGVPSIF